jgi:tRNA U34 5-carboxymethylaminomethyl modifying GTPase MnmE/TrmE
LWGGAVKVGEGGVGGDGAAIAGGLSGGGQCGSIARRRRSRLGRPNRERVKLSAKCGAGVKQLTGLILKKLGAASADEGIFTAKRHIELAKKAAEHLRACERALKGGIAVDQAADDLWRADKLLAEITGKNATDDVIDAIFRNFCVGK